MQADDDVLAGLRALYEGLEPSEPGGELGDADPETRRTVAWLREAFEALEPLGLGPALDRTRAYRAASGPAALAPPLLRRVLPRWAAALMVSAGLAAVLLEQAGRSGRDAVHLAQGSVQEAPPAARPSIAHLGPDRVEMRSGPVRLILLTGPPHGGPSTGEPK